MSKFGVASIGSVLGMIYVAISFAIGMQVGSFATELGILGLLAAIIGATLARMSKTRIWLGSVFFSIPPVAVGIIALSDNFTFLNFAIVAIVGSMVGALLKYLGTPKAYRERSCQGRAWHNSFPEIEKDAVREFLKVFTTAFGKNSQDILKFSPNDRILDIYRARYSGFCQVDSLELETFAQALERRYCLNLEAYWSETLTLGELFAHIQGRAAFPVSASQ